MINPNPKARRSDFLANRKLSARTAHIFCHHGEKQVGDANDPLWDLLAVNQHEEAKMSSNINGGNVSPILRQSFRPKVSQPGALDMRPANALIAAVASSYPYSSQDRSTCQEKCNIRTLARSWGCRRRWISRRASSVTPRARAS